MRKSDVLIEEADLRIFAGRKLISLDACYGPNVAQAFDGIDASLTGPACRRESTRDEIYAIGGNLVRSGKKSDARYTGRQAELALSWQAPSELNFSASLRALELGAFIEDAGPAQTIRMIGLSATSRF